MGHISYPICSCGFRADFPHYYKPTILTPQGRNQFGSHGHGWQEYGRDNIQKIQALGLVVSEMFLVFPIVSLCELSVAMETTILILSVPKPNAVEPVMVHIDDDWPISFKNILL